MITATEKQIVVDPWEGSANWLSAFASRWDAVRVQIGGPTGVQIAFLELDEAVAVRDWLDGWIAANSVQEVAS